MFLKVAFGKTVTYQQNVNPDHLTRKPPMEQVQLSKVQCRCLCEPKHDFSGCSVQDCPAHNAPCVSNSSGGGLMSTKLPPPVSIAMKRAPDTPPLLCSQEHREKRPWSFQEILPIKTC